MGISPLLHHNDLCVIKILSKHSFLDSVSFMRVYIHVYYPSIYHLYSPLPRVIQVGKMSVVELENATNKTPPQTAMVSLGLPDIMCVHM